jgi:hypothetical protein
MKYAHPVWIGQDDLLSEIKKMMQNIFTKNVKKYYKEDNEIKMIDARVMCVTSPMDIAQRLKRKNGSPMDWKKSKTDMQFKQRNQRDGRD